MASIGGRVREAVATVLQDLAVGLNANLAIHAAMLGLDLEPGDVLTFSWDPTDGQYYRSQISFDSLTATGDLRFPICVLYATSSDDLRYRKYNEYSGTVRVVAAFYLSLLPGNAVNNAELYQDAMENAFITTMHTATASGVMALQGAYFLRDTSWQRGEIVQGGENWLIPSQALMTFEVDQ